MMPASVVQGITLVIDWPADDGEIGVRIPFGFTEADGVTYSFGVFYIKFLDYFKEGKGATAWIASILVGVTLCSGPVSSSFVNRFGCRLVTIGGAILGSVCMALSIFAPNVTTLYLTIGVGTGFGFGLIYLPAIVSVTCYFEKYRSLATGIAVCGSGLGTFIFAPLTGILIESLEWQGAMLVISGLVLSCALLGIMFRPLEIEDPIPVSPSPKFLEANTVNKYELVPSDAITDLHSAAKKNSSEHDLSTAVNGLHRPHSISHFTTIPRTARSQPFHVAKGSGGTDATRLALSQPALLTSPDNKFNFGSQSLRRKNSGIMHRKDIFYRGSLHNIPYHRSAPRLTQDKVAEESQPLKLVVERERTSCCAETRETLREMLDFSLLKDPVFILFTGSNFLTSIGFNMPYLYIVAQAKERGVSESYANYLLSVIGIANLVGRIILGYISDKPWINRLAIYNTCLTLCGLGTAMSAFCRDMWTFAFYASVFGFTIGAYVGLTSVILVDLLGLDKLTNAFGLLLLFQGIASFVGPPIGGFLYDALGSYDYAFYVAGVTIGASGLILFFIPYLQRRTLRTNVKQMLVVVNGNICLESFFLSSDRSW
uniref:(California timema) hypothetical protein n=1 Tax=Timema californicum TaxID=61474 RepID=A0A7R9P7A0_TIMCA|nr:unnamed protein product [Timema californicum]